MFRSSVTPKQFEYVRKYFPVVKCTRPKKYTDYDMFSGLLYVLCNGTKWRELPSCFPPWKSVYWFMTKLIGNHTLDIILRLLSTLERECRDIPLTQRHILITDTKSVRTTCYTNKKYTGYDGHKKIKGMKLCLLCDTSGNIWNCRTAPANTAEREKIKNQVIWYTTMKAHNQVFTVLLADKGYESKKLIQALKNYKITLYPMKSTKWIKHTTTIPSNKEQKDMLTYFNKQISKLRYVVERTFGWIDTCRRVIVCYERKARRYEEFVKLALVRILLKRLVK